MGPAGKQAGFAEDRLLTLNQKEHSGGQQVWQEGGLGGARRPVLPCYWRPAGSAGEGGNKTSPVSASEACFPFIAALTAG